MDERIKILARNLVNYSCKIQSGEKVLISVEGASVMDLAECLIAEVYAAGGYPFIELGASNLTRRILLGAKEEQMALMNDLSLYKIKHMDAFISVRASENMAELSDVPGEAMQAYMRIMRPALDARVNGTKWVVLRYANNAMAQKAFMSKEAFTNYYFDVCNLDYGKMDQTMEALKVLMDKTDQVRITGPGTDLTFSIKGLQAVKCAGEMNIPDGEIYTAPVKDSVNGVLTYNTPSDYQGFIFRDVRFEFQHGRIVKATCNDNERIARILDTDEGARYIGEFALGVNPYILEPMMDTLFDEKIAGSFHFTPGAAYRGEADNSNRSAIHWDLVAIQRPEYGGGEIYFDGVKIREDGRFVLESLAGLNVENLK